MRRHTTPHLLHIQAYGDPALPTVILLHGLMGSWRTWHTVIESLTGKYHFVAIDLLGFGDSPKPKEAKYDRHDHIAALKLTLEHYGYASPHMIVGFSLGSVLAMYLVKERAIKTDRLLLIGSPLYASKGEMGRRIKRSPTPAIFRRGPVAKAAHTMRRRSAYITRIIAKMTHPSVPSMVIDDIRRVPYYAYIRTRKRVLEHDSVVSKLPRIDYIHVLVGSHDPYADISHLAALTKKRGELEIIPHIGHSVPFSSPQSIVSAITSLSAREQRIPTKYDREI